MQYRTRNETPIGYALNFATNSNINFAVKSPFNNGNSNISSTPPPPSNSFLLLDGSNFLLLDGTDLLLL